MKTPWDTIGVKRGTLSTLHALAHNVIGYTETPICKEVEALLADPDNPGLREVTF